MRLGVTHRAFLSRRFDRTDTGERIHFASAMTLLERVDGHDEQAGASYLELADLLAREGARPRIDLEQLWRRIVFSMCVSNVDDHLRNHGFVLDPAAGWRLAPAYDLNPVPAGSGLRLNVSETDNAQDLELAREVAPFFRLELDRVDAILEEVVAAVRTWREVADELGLPRAEQERMARAFRLVAR